MPDWTPGPWSVEVEEFEECLGTIYIPQINQLIHDSGEEWASHDEWKRDLANSRLIALAPELYAALEALEARFNVSDRYPLTANEPTLLKAWELLAKVRGPVE
jgi:hypothetical protein